MRLLAGTATGGLLAIASSTSHAATYDSLPAPMASFSPKLEYVLYLGLSVNGNALAGTVPVKVSNDRYWVSASVLRQAYIPLPEGETLVDVSQIPSVQFEYDQAGQMLKLKVPDSWLPEQRIDNTGEQNYHRPLSTPGLLFNYDSYSLV